MLRNWHSHVWSRGEDGSAQLCRIFRILVLLQDIFSDSTFAVVMTSPELGVVSAPFVDKLEVPINEELNVFFKSKLIALYRLESLFSLYS